MTDHQFSKHFSLETDTQYKETEFENKLGDFIKMFVQCYPHAIKKTVKNGVDVWIFRFTIDEK